MSFRILVGIYCHNIPTHTPHSRYHGVTEVAKTPNIKNGSKVHKLHERSSHSAPCKPDGVGTRKHFFGSKSNKTKRFMILVPRKGGGRFLTPPHPLPQNLKKVGFKWGGVSGGSGPKTHWTICFLGKIMILQGVKRTIQPLGVGYANRPKMGGMWRFSLYTPAWL